MGKAWENGLGMKSGMVAILAVVLLAGYIVTPSYGLEGSFETDFEADIFPPCASEPVAIKGTTKFTIESQIDDNGKTESVSHMESKARGEGISSGTL